MGGQGEEGAREFGEVQVFFPWKAGPKAMNTGRTPKAPLRQSPGIHDIPGAGDDAEEGG
jgi:hypothetical protein